jgi:TIR domain
MDFVSYLLVAVAFLLIGWVFWKLFAGPAANRVPDIPLVSGNVEEDYIFISYRRSDSQDVTDRISERLSSINVGGSKRVFRDVENDIRPGDDFRTRLKQALGRCRICLVIIGNGWLEAKDSDGRRRLDDPTDYVRQEVETALLSDARVIPVLVQNATMPRANMLPESIRQLAFCEAIRVRPNPDFDRDFSNLAVSIQNHPVGSAEQPKDQQ